MKKYQKIIVAISVVLLINITSTFGQTEPIYVEDVEITSLENLEYISIIIVSKGLGTKSKVIVDYGQKINWLSLGNPKIRSSKDGKVKAFNGAIEALNFFYKKGWEFVTQTQMEIGVTGEIGFVFLLKRK